MPPSMGKKTPKTTVTFENFLTMTARLNCFFLFQRNVDLSLDNIVELLVNFAAAHNHKKFKYIFIFYY